ncbi:MAG: DNA polymerase III, subunit gamma and tau [uncultured bacterium (gcode 4)]|uniref:DNA polymerase III subunit gamma/tau n=1 Tax=uncultured bacterium (gcode 4) TaxID=1234023 RepID=K2GX57_9BACT|nr:MAG: DNA polymerase III, subunit gamma and tau [uncultured bacterium (gcode 4)]
MSLYQKYRPKDFDSLVWQEFVKISLKNALEQNRLVWAYLFYGSRGTGKTTTARILAKWMNCLDLKKDGNPCLECTNCLAFEREELLDIIEIDAASNTWVDNIRDLIEKAQFQPNQSKYKVYIIDEVHMLSKWAFNALLKTLEEPPVHVKFILATTEIHKIPETIISRTQRYDFKRINENDIIDRLKFIAHSENIVAEEPALSLIARLSRWWLRDAIAFFEQYSIGGNLKLDYLKDNLQLVWDEFLKELIENLVSKSRKEVIVNIDFLRTKWIDVKIFLEELTFYLHNLLLSSENPARTQEYMGLYELFLEIYSRLKFVPNTFMLLEFSFIKYLTWFKKQIQEEYAVEVKKEIKSAIKDRPKEIPPAKIEEKNELTSFKEEITIKEVQKTEENIKKEEKAPSANSRFEIDTLIDSMKKDKWRWFVAMSLKSSKLSLKDWELSIYVNNKFNYDKVSSPEIKVYIAGKLSELFATDAQVSVVLDAWSGSSDIMADVMDVF